MALAQKHTNDRGDVKWQPMLDDGDQCWDTRLGKVWKLFGYSYYGTYSPKLYKNKDRALRVARRREHKEAGWFREVSE